MNDSLELDAQPVIYIVNDLDKLKFAMKKLSENYFVAFDVEPNLLYPNDQATPGAAELQLAFADCILLIDFIKLVQTVPADQLRLFFEMFLGMPMRRIGFDIKKDLDVLRNSFPWITDFLNHCQPIFYSIQKFTHTIQTSTILKGVFPEFPKADAISLKICCDTWLNTNVNKPTRGSRWLRRPVDAKEVMYAGLDAKKILDCYNFIHRTLRDRNLGGYLNELIVTPRDLDKKKKLGPKEKKETWKKMEKIVVKKVKEMKRMYHEFEEPRNITIVLDTNFLPIAPYLRRIGFQVFDQRHLENGGQMSREEVINALSKYIRDRISDATIQFCYLVTDHDHVSRFETEADISEAKIIPCLLNESESSIICSIISTTRTVFDCSDVSSWCAKCGQKNILLDVPSDIFRVVYIHYAKQKGFFRNLKITDNPNKILRCLKNLHVVEVIDNWMIHNFDEDAYIKFSLNDEICAEFFCRNPNDNGAPYIEKKKYKCNTRLFETLDNAETVDFCVECFEFI